MSSIYCVVIPSARSPNGATRDGSGKPAKFMKLIIGLTGGIGTGKSSLLAEFGRLGAATISLDELAHRLSRKGKPVYRGIVREFGTKYLDSAGQIDRQALGKAVFANPALRRRLERVTHPAILREMRRLIAGSRRPVTVADVPLLFEAGLQKEFDATIVASLPEREALRRIRRRGDLSPAQARLRMKAQMPLSSKERLADVVIHNRGGLNDLRRKVREYYRAFELIALSGVKKTPGEFRKGSE